MDEEFIRNRITELRLKKGVSEYQMSMDLGQNKNYVQAISSGRALPSKLDVFVITFQTKGLKIFNIVQHENNSGISLKIKTK